MDSSIFKIVGLYFDNFNKLKPFAARNFPFSSLFMMLFLCEVVILEFFFYTLC